MGFYVRDYYCGNGNVVLHTTYLSPTCPEPTDPTDTPYVLQAVKLATVVRPTAYAVGRFGGGGDAGYPDPEGDGHIPTPITPIAHPLGDVLTEADLPQLHQQLTAALKMVDAAFEGLKATPEQLKGLSAAIAGSERN